MAVNPAYNVIHAAVLMIVMLQNWFDTLSLKWCLPLLAEMPPRIIALEIVKGVSLGEKRY